MGISVFSFAEMNPCTMEEILIDLLKVRRLECRKVKFRRNTVWDIVTEQNRTSHGRPLRELIELSIIKPHRDFLGND
jgi:hypothetical protein